MVDRVLQVLEAVRTQAALTADADGVRDRSIELEGGDIVIVFGLAGYPDNVRFGYRMEASPASPPEDWSPEGWAGVVVANWREAFMASDADLRVPDRSQGIRWID